MVLADIFLGIAVSGGVIGICYLVFKALRDYAEYLRESEEIDHSNEMEA